MLIILILFIFPFLSYCGLPVAKPKQNTNYSRYSIENRSICMAELIRAEKELSDLFPERSEFSYTDRSGTDLTLVFAFLPIILAKTSTKMTL